MEKEIKIKSVCQYVGHSINNAGIVGLNLNFDFQELPKIIQMMQLLNEDIETYCRINSETLKIGTFGIKDIKINANGESKIKLIALLHSTDINALNSIIEQGTVSIAFKSTIEL